ncbi:MAG: DUF6198 family protein [Synergistaceae bacterium]
MFFKNVFDNFNSSVFLRKLVCYLAGLFLIAVGINVSKTGGLGISPVSATPYALEVIWGIELGRATAIVLVFLVFVQMLLLRKNYKVIQLLQFFTLFVLSFFVTYTSRKFLLCWLPLPSNYIISLLYTVLSSVIIGVGVSFYLIPKWIPMPPEGLAVAITQTGKKSIPIHTAKNIVDLSMVTVAIVLSLIMTGKVVAVREGTIIVALLVGRFVGFGNKLYKDKIIEWIYK